MRSLCRSSCGLWDGDATRQRQGGTEVVAERHDELLIMAAQAKMLLPRVRRQAHAGDMRKHKRCGGQRPLPRGPGFVNGGACWRKAGCRMTPRASSAGTECARQTIAAVAIPAATAALPEAGGATSSYEASANVHARRAQEWLQGKRKSPGSREPGLLRLGVEARGFEPRSENRSTTASTCVFHH
jgi:hypothetical protein